jgi:prophage tail gpP-like protein
MEQKVIITDNTYDVNGELSSGWKVVSVTAQFVATGSSFETRGKFCFVLERG